MTKKPFDPTKPVQTREGRPARIICTDRSHPDFPIIALVTGLDGRETFATFTTQGKFFALSESSLNLVNVPERKSRWANSYRNNVGGEVTVKKFTVIPQTPERKLVGVLTTEGCLYFNDEAGCIRFFERKQMYTSMYASFEQVLESFGGTPIYEGDAVQIQF